MSKPQVLGRSLAGVFDPKLNALNAIRLLLAISVIVWHTYPITGAARPPRPVTQLLGETGVDGFFAISGFLIVSSWMRNPKWWPYLQARCLRILPGFWVCLIVTAALIAPAGILLSGQALPHHYALDAAGYVWNAAALKITQFGIGGTPTGVPYPGVWDGSLWTLWWEFLCYLGVLLLGLSRVIKYTVTIPIVFVVCLAGLILVTVGVTDNFYVVNGSRFGLMFAAGVLIYQFQHHIPARWWLVAIAGAVVAAASLVPDYRVVAAIPLAYLVITVGALVKQPRVRLTNDISYGVYIYGFALQQLLAMAGLYRLGVPLFAAVSISITIPIALASWFLIEKPAMRLRTTKKAPARKTMLAKPGLQTVQLSETRTVPGADGDTPQPGAGEHSNGKVRRVQA